MPEADSKAALQELEEQRKHLARAKGNSYYCIAAGLIVGITGVVTSLPVVVIMGVIIILIGFFLLYNVNNRIAEYAYIFKGKVICAILRDIDPSLSIEPDNGLSEAEFINCGMFTRRPDRMMSQDQVTGRVGKTAFCFSEVHAEYKTTTTTKHGTQVHWHDIFKGVVFAADFNKNFKGITVVRAKDIGTAVSAWFAKNVPLLSANGQDVVDLENPDFCEEFVTYSTDQVEARYILTPAMMERLCELNARSANTISVSFINSYMFLAFPLDKNYFEPPVFKSLMDPDLLVDDIEIVKFMRDIVHDLDLNTRIWGK
jgi:hypothetical protein